MDGCVVWGGSCSGAVPSVYFSLHLCFGGVSQVSLDLKVSLLSWEKCV